MSEPRVQDAVALSLSGPEGVVDVLVPSGSSAGDLAARYRDEVASAALPLMFSLTGAVLPPDRTLDELGVEPGDVVVAAYAVPRPTTARSAREAAASGVLADGLLVRTVLAVAAGCALLAAAAVVAGADGAPAAWVVGLLAVASLLGVVDGGRYAAARSAVAPAFAAAAVLAWTWRPEPEALPMVLGFSGLAAAAAASVARARRGPRDEPLVVWMVAGVALFVVSGVATLAGLPPVVVWSLVLLLALFAARISPALAVDVPDQLLVDLERLAVTAWSARDAAPGRRGRTVVSSAAVAQLAHRAGRGVTAAAVASGLLVGVASALLLRTDRPLDRVGAQCLVGLAAVGLLLAARNHRHPGARWALRLGGLGAAIALAVHLLPARSPATQLAVAAVALAVAVATVVGAVATGRGWRSAWWARRAEVAETLSLGGAVAATVVSTGGFRQLWEIASVRFGG